MSERESGPIDPSELGMDENKVHPSVGDVVDSSVGTLVMEADDSAQAAAEAQEPHEAPAPDEEVQIEGVTGEFVEKSTWIDIPGSESIKQTTKEWRSYSPEEMAAKAAEAKAEPEEIPPLDFDELYPDQAQPEQASAEPPQPERQVATSQVSTGVEKGNQEARITELVADIDPEGKLPDRKARAVATIALAVENNGGQITEGMTKQLNAALNEVDGLSAFRVRDKLNAEQPPIKAKDLQGELDSMLDGRKASDMSDEQVDEIVHALSRRLTELNEETAVQVADLVFAANTDASENLESPEAKEHINEVLSKVIEQLSNLPITGKSNESERLKYAARETNRFASAMGVDLGFMPEPVASSAEAQPASEAKPPRKIEVTGHDAPEGAASEKDKATEAMLGDFEVSKLSQERLDALKLIDKKFEGKLDIENLDVRLKLIDSIDKLAQFLGANNKTFTDDELNKVTTQYIDFESLVAYVQAQTNSEEEFKDRFDALQDGMDVVLQDLELDYEILHTHELLEETSPEYGKLQSDLDDVRLQIAAMNAGLDYKLTGISEKDKAELSEEHSKLLDRYSQLKADLTEFICSARGGEFSDFRMMAGLIALNESRLYTLDHGVELENLHDNPDLLRKFLDFSSRQSGIKKLLFAGVVGGGFAATSAVSVPTIALGAAGAMSRKAVITGAMKLGRRAKNFVKNKFVNESEKPLPEEDFTFREDMDIKEFFDKSSEQDAGRSFEADIKKRRVFRNNLALGTALAAAGAGVGSAIEISSSGVDVNLPKIDLPDLLGRDSSDTASVANLGDASTTPPVEAGDLDILSTEGEPDISDAVNLGDASTVPEAEASATETETTEAAADEVPETEPAEDSESEAESATADTEETTDEETDQEANEEPDVSDAANLGDASSSPEGATEAAAETEGETAESDQESEVQTEQEPENTAEQATGTEASTEEFNDISESLGKPTDYIQKSAEGNYNIVAQSGAETDSIWQASKTTLNDYFGRPPTDVETAQLTNHLIENGNGSGPNNFLDIGDEVSIKSSELDALYGTEEEVIVDPGTTVEAEPLDAEEPAETTESEPDISDAANLGDAQTAEEFAASQAEAEAATEAAEGVGANGAEVDTSTPEAASTLGSEIQELVANRSNELANQVSSRFAELGIEQGAAFDAALANVQNFIQDQLARLSLDELANQGDDVLRFSNEELLRIING